jgi:hypothetical protein
VVRLGYTTTSNEIIGVVAASGVQAAMTHTVSDTTLFNKLAVKYKENDFALWINGFEVDTDTLGSTPVGLNTLEFDVSGVDDFYGKSKQVMTFNEALSDTELENLTSWDSFREMATGQQGYSVY